MYPSMSVVRLRIKCLQNSCTCPCISPVYMTYTRPIPHYVHSSSEVAWTARNAPSCSALTSIADQARSSSSSAHFALLARVQKCVLFSVHVGLWFRSSAVIPTINRCNQYTRISRHEGLYMTIPQGWDAVR